MALVILTFLLYVFPIIFAQDTAKKNISSSSSSVQFIGNWRSDLNVGYYEVSIFGQICLGICYFLELSGLVKG